MLIYWKLTTYSNKLYHKTIEQYNELNKRLMTRDCFYFREDDIPSAVLNTYGPAIETTSDLV